MKASIIFTCFLFLSVSYFTSAQDSITSKEIEIQGWNLYFKGDRSLASQKFRKALEYDKTNILAKIGLFNSRELSNNNEVETIDLLESIPKKKVEGIDLSGIMLQLYLDNQTAKQAPELLIQKMKYDGDYIELRAMLTDSKLEIRDENGVLRKEGEYKNRKPYGDWKIYNFKEKLLFSYSYSQTSDTVITTYYKPDGVVVSKKWTKGDPLHDSSYHTTKEVVFWQKDKGKSPEYLFVSSEGFKVYDKENPVKFDHTTPDNIIQQIWNPEKKEMEAVIWKNGKKIPHKICEYNGTLIREKIDGNTKVYRWENCKKILIEDKND